MLLQVNKYAAYLVPEDLPRNKMDIRTYTFFIAQSNKYGDASSVMVDEEHILILAGS